MIRRAALAAGALLVLLAFPPAADAILVARDSGPAAVAVDQAGTAYVAYASGRRVRVCRVVMGIVRCRVIWVFNAQEAAGVRPGIFIGPAGEVVVLAAQLVQSAGPPHLRWLAWTSRDGGATFGGPSTPPATTSPLVLSNQALVLGNRLLDLTAKEEPNGGVFARSTPLGADPSGLGARLFDGPRPNPSPTGKGPAPSFDTAIGALGGRVIVVVSDAGAASLAVQPGSGDFNDASTWGPRQSLAGSIRPTQLVAVSGQLFLGASEGGGSFRVRRFDGSTFDAGTTVIPGSSRGSIAAPRLTAGPGGGLAAAWGFGDTLRLRTSSDGVSWSATRAVACGNGSPEALALPSAGGPVVVFRDVDSLRLVRAGGSPGPCPGNPPSLRRGATTLTLVSPADCLTSGQRVRLEVLTRGRRPGVVRVTFRIGSGRSVTARRAATLRLPATGPDSLVAARAAVTLSGSARPLVLRDRLRTC